VITRTAITSIRVNPFSDRTIEVLLSPPFGGI